VTRSTDRAAVGATGRPVDMVVFDVGETLVSEERVWADWARWLGVSPAVLAAALGSCIAGRLDHRDAFAIVRPGIDLDRERTAKEAAGVRWAFDRDDLYPDAVPCLGRLRRAGIRTAIAANQPAAVGPMLEAMGLGVEFVATSATWGVTKPHPDFFERLTRAADLPPGRIAYVGDRLDNDVLPARRAGMVGVLIRRGPWGHLHATWPERDGADAVIDSLDELPAVLGRRPSAPVPP
jgi:FMN phosphatase YigB (HAD superfamily)